MENPANKTVRAMWFTVLGIVIGLIPGAIKIDQMRREVAATTESTAKTIAELHAKVDNLVEHDEQIQQTSLDRSKYSTILISKYGPMPHREMIGVTDPWSNIDASLMPGTIWVIPGIVAPHTLNPDDRAAWAIVHPDGSIGKWLAPQVASDVTTVASNR